jgi:hypothetical protein
MIQKQALIRCYKDNGAYHKAWTGNQWQSDWENLGGVFTSPLAVSSWGNNRLDVFGLGTVSI